MMIEHPLLEPKSEGEYEMEVKIANDESTASSGSRNENKLLAFLILGKLPQQSPSPARCSIFRIPTILSSNNEKAFVPYYVSIGPFYHGEKNLQVSEELKLWYLHCLLDRKPNRETSLENFIEAVRRMEQYCRDCYDEKIHMDSDKFVEMMVVDGCFIIEIFCKYTGVVRKVKDDPAAYAPWMYGALLNDLLLLENQIPWRVVDCLFDLTCEIKNLAEVSLASLTLAFLGRNALAFNPQVKGELENKHLLDFIRNCLLGSYVTTNIFQSEWKPIPCVTELIQAGVKFKRGNVDDILNITFKDGEMEIPPIIVQENGESLLRNLIAYEQCEKGYYTKIASYAVLLDNLINTSADIDFLIQEGIIQIYLSTQDTACFFNGLCSNVPVINFSYAGLTEKVHEYYQGRWHRWRAILIRDYFNNPWSILSFTAAFFILGFTLTQTIYSVVSYHN